MSSEDGFKRFITGHGSYVDDMHLDGMLHLKVVRSRYARARILSVKGGINGGELKIDLPSVGEGAGGGASPVRYPVLASQYVSYAGQPVAGVLADDPYKAEDAMDQVEVEYEPLRPVTRPEEALRSEPIHPGTRSNVISSVRLGEDFSSDAPVAVEDELENARVIPNPLETRGTVVHYDGSRLTVWASTQSVHTWKQGIREALRLPQELVRVVQMDTGGAFGTKSGLYPEYIIASYASMKTRRPVKWVETRSESLLATCQGRGASAKVKLFADRHGKVDGIKADLLLDGGAYPLGMSSWAPRGIGFQITGPYAIRKAFVAGMSVYTNKVPMGPYRGAGRPEAAFFMERMMDMLADELKMDPVQLRLANVSRQPFNSPLGLAIEPYEPFLRDAIDALGYRKTEREAAGFSCFVLVPALQPGESAKISVDGGKVRVWMGGSQGGQGHDAMARRIVSEELGVPEGVVELERGDTDCLDSGVGTWGSRTAIVGGGALVDAARKLRREAKERLKEYSPEELLKRHFEATVFHSESGQLNSFGANLVTASLEASGKAILKECAAYYDPGRVINQPMVESQIIGGSVQGAGQVLSEEARYSEEGQLLFGTISDAGVPTAEMAPRVIVRIASHPSNLPHGAKGVGEAPTIGVPPAAVRALERAVGRRLRRTPLHPEELNRLMRG